MPHRKVRFSVRNIRRMPLVALAGLLIAAALLPAGASAAAGRGRAVASRGAATSQHHAAGVSARARAPRLALGRRLLPHRLPVVYSFPVAAAAGMLTPDRPPPGANDWSCRPSAAHPFPVVLVHGTFENMIINWNALSPLLANNGYCVFALNFGSKGGLPIKALGPIADSAAELRAFVDQVLAVTGAAKVDMVGHSQGGMMPRQYLKFEGGYSKVHTLVGLSPSNHGTSASHFKTLLDLIPGASALLNGVLDVTCEACNDQFTGSQSITALNAGGDTFASVSYTVIASRHDEVITPYTSSFLTGRDVTNITVQDGCLLDGAEHVAISYDRRALTYVLNALDPAHPITPPCGVVLPLVGG
jgi:triacylglycerol esterase/lipase EstA (alpha/beta hydrolase family)